MENNEDTEGEKPEDVTQKESTNFLTSFLIMSSTTHIIFAQGN